MPTFKEAISSKDFVVTSEVFLHPDSDAESIREQADVLRDVVDGVLVSDNQTGRLHMSSLAAAIMLKNFGVDPILQLSCRNRNRIGLLGDLLGAGAHGITTLQLIRGERVPDGFEPRPKAVLDVSATELIATARKMKGEGGLGKCPDFLLGGVITTRIPKPNWVPHKLVEKIDAGAQFLLTHTCMDADLIRQYAKHLVASGILRRVNIIVSIAILSSAQEARWLRDNRPNVLIPKAVVKRLELATDAATEGKTIAIELLQDFAAIPGIGGAHLYSIADLRNVPDVVLASGIRVPAPVRLP